MPTGEVKSASRRLSEPSATVGLIVAAWACAAALMWIERPAPPREMPPLTLPADAVRAAIAADREAAARAPQDAGALALDGLFLESRRAERLLFEPEQTVEGRRQALADGYRRLVARVGEDGAMALRAAAVERVEAALDLKLPKEQLKDVIGGLPRVLDASGQTVDGEIVAPRFVVRVTVKARWNLAHGLKPEHGLNPIERRAFFGWKALHTERVPPVKRLDALVEYARAGGDRVDEAQGILLFLAGEARSAAEVFARAHRKHGGLRLRNHALAARLAAAPQ